MSVQPDEDKLKPAPKTSVVGKINKAINGTLERAFNALGQFIARRPVLVIVGVISIFLCTVHSQQDRLNRHARICITHMCAIESVLVFVGVSRVQFSGSQLLSQHLQLVFSNLTICLGKLAVRIHIYALIKKMNAYFLFWFLKWVVRVCLVQWRSYCPSFSRLAWRGSKPRQGESSFCLFRNVSFTSLLLPWCTTFGLFGFCPPSPPSIHVVGTISALQLGTHS